MDGKVTLPLSINIERSDETPNRNESRITGTLQWDEVGSTQWTTARTGSLGFNAPAKGPNISERGK